VLGVVLVVAVVVIGVVVVVVGAVVVGRFVVVLTTLSSFRISVNNRFISIRFKSTCLE
jgi:hypothetical protein